MIRQIFAFAALFVSHALWGATFTVDTTQAGDSVFLRACTSAPGDCSFRGALLNANANVDLDTIAFDIPANKDAGCSSATGICTLPSPGSFTSVFQGDSISAITTEIIIDGFTQPGATPNTLSADGNGIDANLKIEVSRVQTGLRIINGATIKGIAFFDAGTEIYLSKHFANALPIVIEGCYFGARADGTLSDIGSFGTIATVDIGRVVGTFISQAPLGENNIRIGGTLPAQRNWFPRARLFFFNAINRIGQQYQASVQGNLFGTNKSGGFLADQSQTIETVINIAPFGSITANLIIGGDTAAARNVFAGRMVDAITAPAGIGPTITTVHGNYFGLTVGGLSNPALLSTTPGLLGTRMVVGGALPGQANTFAVGLRGFGAALFENGGDMSILTNTFVRASAPLRQLPFTPGAIARFSGDGFVAVNDLGDADAGPQQNHPEISAFNVLANDLAINYKVDSQAANSEYPLTVEFYRSDALASYAPTTFLGRDVYTAAEAGSNKAINIALPAGHGMTNEDVITAIATQANNKGSSNFSWYPANLTFVGNQGGAANTPVSIRVRMQGLVSRPRGEVRLEFGPFSSSPPPPCIITLLPVAASPLLAEGTCMATFAFQGAYSVNARYLDIEQAFHAIDGTTPVAVRQITITPALTPDIFCHGFEDNSNGTCRALP